MSHQTVVVTALNFPATWAACQAMALDSGLPVRRSDTYPTNAGVSTLRTVETFIAGLSPSEVETFVAGEESEALAVAARSAAGQMASNVLNYVFDHVLCGAF